MKKNKRSNILRIVLIGSILFFTGAIILLLANYLRNILILFVSLLLLIASFLVLIIYFLALFRFKNFWGRLRASIGIFCCGILLILTCGFLLGTYLPYIYTPPALTQENLLAYNESIKFFKNHEGYSSLGWDKHNNIIIGNSSYITSPLLLKENFIKETGFPENAFIEIEHLSRQCDNVQCYKVLRDNNIVLFYKYANYILPDSPGVAYSLDRSNPNSIDSESLNKNKPFIKISDNWYMSRSLIVRNWRGLEFPLPKALIDRSLQTKGLALNSDLRQ